MADPTPPAPQPDAIEAAHTVFVLAFDLVEAELSNAPDQLQQTLNSPQVKAAIEKTLLDFLKSQGANQDKVFNAADAKKLGESLQKNVTDPATTVLGNILKGTPEYKRLEKSLEAFQKAAKASTLGVWANANKTILYIVGAALVLGTGTVLYVTKTGGDVLDTALSPLEDKNFEVLQVGKLTLKAGLWDFKPDARILGARVAASLDWQRVKVQLTIGVLAQDAELKTIEGGAIIKSGPVNINLTASGMPQTQQVNLGLKVGYTAGNLNIGVGAMYKDDQVSGTAGIDYKTKVGNFGLSGNIGPNTTGGSGPAYGGMATWTIPLGK